MYRKFSCNEIQRLSLPLWDNCVEAWFMVKPGWKYLWGPSQPNIHIETSCCRQPSPKASLPGYALHLVKRFIAIKPINIQVTKRNRDGYRCKKSFIIMCSVNIESWSIWAKFQIVQNTFKSKIQNQHFSCWILSFFSRRAV